MPYMMASHYGGGSGAPALPHFHYRADGHFCALPNRRDLGHYVLLSSRHGTPLGRFLVADVCGTSGRCDIPTSTFRNLFGAAGMRRGLVPVTVTRIGGAWRGGYGPHTHRKHSR